MQESDMNSEKSSEENGSSNKKFSQKKDFFVKEVDYNSLNHYSKQDEIKHLRNKSHDSFSSILKKKLQPKQLFLYRKNLVREKEINSNPNKNVLNKIIGKEKYFHEDYNYIKHGPLVDFTISTEATYKEVDVYRVNPPYSYIRIVHEPHLHEYQYHVIEPILTDSENKLLEFIKTKISETLTISLEDLEIDKSTIRIKEHVYKLVSDYNIYLFPKSREKILYFILRDHLGYGKINSMMEDPNLEDISCDRPKSPIYVYHNKYGSIPSNVLFENDDLLDSFVIKLAQRCNKHISIANPLLDASLPDGSRVQLTLGKEVTSFGSNFTIRKFRDMPMVPSELIENKTYSADMMAYLWVAINGNKSILFAGGTASGKTTSMNAASMFISPELKVVSIEDTREINLNHPNWVPSVTRQSFTGEDRGSIEMYELLRTALRQRPEYILVGEVRGSEAYVLFQAMSTGHTTLSTMHGDSVTSVIHRFENPPINIPRIMLQGLNIIAIIEKVTIGGKRVRRCTSITEIVGLDSRTGEVITNEVFLWSPENDSFTYTGKSYIFENIMKSKGLSEEELSNEMKNRRIVLQWAVQEKINNYKKFSNFVVRYSKEPEKLINSILKDLKVHD